MSYRRHQAVDLSAGTTHTFTSIPTTEDMIFTARGILAGAAGAGALTLRPNNDSTAGRYKGVSFYHSAVAVAGGNVHTNMAMDLGYHTGGGLVNIVARLAKAGTYWTYIAQSIETAGGADPAMRSPRGNWNPNGVALTTLRFDVNLFLAITFTGHIELWYQDA